MIRHLSCCAAPVVLAALIALPAPAATYLVRPDGTGDFATIQLGIYAAADGDIIELADGVFTGDGNRDIDYFGKAITIRSQSSNAGACIINCEADDDERHRGFYFHSGEGGESVLENVTIHDAYAPYDYEGDWGGGILCDASSPLITGCRITECYAGWGGGMLCIYNASPAITDCLFDGNQGRVNGGGLYCSGGSDPILTRVTFTGNRSVDKGGAVVCNGASPTLIHCTLAKDNAAHYGSGLWSLGGAEPVFTNTIIAFGTHGGAVLCEGGMATMICCDIYGNAGGDWTGCIANQLGIGGNISADPRFCDLDNEDYTLADDSPCAEENNVECGQIGAWGIGCSHPTPVEMTTIGRIKSGYRN